MPIVKTSDLTAKVKDYVKVTPPLLSTDQNYNKRVRERANEGRPVVENNASIYRVRDLRGVNSLVTRLPTLAEALPKRADSYCEGVQLLINNSDKTNGVERKILEIAANDLNTLNAAFKENLAKITGPDADKARLKLFNTFMGELHGVVQEATGCKPGEAKKHVQNAEAMYTWDQKREPMVTLTSRTFKRIDKSGNKSDVKHTIAQIDVPICNLTEAQAKEFVAINNESTDKQPIWFKAMDGWQQNYLKEKLKGLNESSENLVSEVNDRLGTVPSAFRSIPGLANAGQHTVMVFEGSGKDKTLVLESTRERSSVVVPIKLKAEASTEKKNIVEKSVDFIVKGVRAATNTLSESEQQLEDKKGELTKQNVNQLVEANWEKAAQRYIENWEPKGTGNEGEAIKVQIPVLVQTLISPVLFDKASPDESKHVLAHKEQAVQEVCDEFSRSDKLTAFQYKGQTYQVELVPIATNHPINSLRKGERSLILSREEAHAAQEAAKFEAMVDLHISNAVQNNQAKGELIREALDSYRAVRATNAVESLHLGQGRQLHLSSLEQIITENIGGIAHSSCKSGKDRKGMELLHTDAMLVFRQKKGHLPKYGNAKDRAEFVKTFADLFLSNHQQAIANQNAAGCFGLKGVRDGLPNDIQQEIDSRFKDQKDSKGNKISNQLDQNFLLSGLNKPSVNPGLLQKITDQVSSLVDAVSQRVSQAFGLEKEKEPNTQEAAGTEPSVLSSLKDGLKNSGDSPTKANAMKVAGIIAAVGVVATPFFPPVGLGLLATSAVLAGGVVGVGVVDSYQQQSDAAKAQNANASNSTTTVFKSTGVGPNAQHSNTAEVGAEQGQEKESKSFFQKAAEKGQSLFEQWTGKKGEANRTSNLNETALDNTENRRAVTNLQSNSKAEVEKNASQTPSPND